MSIFSINKTSSMILHTIWCLNLTICSIYLGHHIKILPVFLPAVTGLSIEISSLLIYWYVATCLHADTQMYCFLLLC